MKWHHVPSPLTIAELSPKKGQKNNKLTFNSIIQAAEEDSVSPSKVSTTKINQITPLQSDKQQQIEN